MKTKTHKRGPVYVDCGPGRIRGVVYTQKELIEVIHSRDKAIKTAKAILHDSGHNKVVTMCLESYPETMTIVEFNNCVDQIVFESKRRTSKHF